MHRTILAAALSGLFLAAPVAAQDGFRLSKLNPFQRASAKADSAPVEAVATDAPAPPDSPAPRRLRTTTTT